MSLTCALCGRDLIRVGLAEQLRCPVHGSRGVTAASEPLPAPSKPVLSHPDYDFGP